MTDYFTSDLHFGHTNILRFTNRPFETIEEMDRCLIANINARVTQNDNLYILGDVAMGRGVDKLSVVRDFLSKLECRNVYLIVGNHDVQDINQLRSCGFKDAWYRHDIKENGFKVVLDHFPLTEWNGYFHGAYHLHGHIHENKEYNLDMRRRGLRKYDVGVDANNYFPVSWDEIEAFFDANKEAYDDRFSSPRN